MSLITSSEYLTPCEYLKKINDIVQCNGYRDAEIRKLVAKSEKLAKEMSIALHKYEPDFYKRYEINETCLSDKKNRAMGGYKYYKIDK